MDRLQRRQVLTGAMALGVTGFSSSIAHAVPAPATEEWRRQISLAQGEGKRLFMLFYASWCGYCRLFDNLLADPQASAIINREFKVFHMRALERTEALKARQIAGADEMYRRFATPSSGLPFYVVFDDAGEPVVTSIAPDSGENIGFPVAKHDLDQFEKIMKRGAPKLTREELATLRSACARMMRR